MYAGAAALGKFFGGLYAAAAAYPEFFAWVHAVGVAYSKTGVGLYFGIPRHSKRVFLRLFRNHLSCAHDLFMIRGTPFMSHKKLQVFVSSTFEDLKEERQAAVEATLSAGHIPAGMELFKAGDEEQMKVIERWIDELDVYVLILGGRWGSVDKSLGKSYTQLEYEYAVTLHKPLFAVVITEKGLDEKIKVLQRVATEQEHPHFKKVWEKNLRINRRWSQLLLTIISPAKQRKR